MGGPGSFPGWRLLFLLPLVGLAIFLYARQPAPAAVVVMAAPNVFGGPVEGGCYQATRTTCSVHIDSWQPIAISAGQRLVAVQLRANGQVLYDFRTDVSNPPVGSYRPSPVRQDFAARCGQSYVLALLAQDTGDAGLVTVGQTNTFTCPAYAADAFRMYMPLVER